MRLINAAAHITGGGLVENLLRSIPEKLTANIDLSKVKIPKIFKWLKKNNISDEEMLKTFNCGVGFCLIVPKKNIRKIKKKFFPKNLNLTKLVLFQKIIKIFKFLIL